MCSNLALIHFDGPFTATQKAILHRTVFAVEQEHTLTQVPEEAGRPWVIVAKQILADGTYYIAHRMGYLQFLRARSVDELRYRIRTAWSPSATRSPWPRSSLSGTT